MLVDGLVVVLEAGLVVAAVAVGDSVMPLGSVGKPIGVVSLAGLIGTTAPSARRD